jgi:hypothetical protein
MFNTYSRPSNPDLHLEDSPYLLDEHGPVFIVGCPRSGTSFLSKCLGSLDDVEAFSGGLCPPRMCHMLSVETDESRRLELLATIRDSLWFALWQRRCFRSNRLLQFFEGQKGISNVIGKASLDGVLLAYKEPFLCFPLERVVDHFPASKVIHIVRDGRDNADSLMRTYPNALSDRVLSNDFLTLNNNSEIGMWKKGRGGKNVPWWVKPEQEEEFLAASQYERFMMLWCVMTKCVLDVQPRIADRFLEVKYEAFVADPMAWGKRIAEFLGVPEGGRYRSNLRKARTSSVAISKANQPPEVIDRGTTAALPCLRRFGYER